MKLSPKIYAITGAVLFHLLLLLWLLLSYLRFPPEGMQWPPTDRAEIIIDPVEEMYALGEFVRTGDNLSPTTPVDTPAPSSETSPEPSQDSSDPVNAGPATPPDPVVTTKRESPAKVQPKPKGPTKEELAAEEARRQAKKQEQARKNVESATARAFGGGKGKSTPGAVDGNSQTGAISGTPGNGLAGRTLEHWDRVSGTKLGTIAIRVKVDASGKVISATYDPAGSHGTAAADAAMRQNCIARSLACRFSVLEGSPVQSGVITWQFR